MSDPTNDIDALLRDLGYSASCGYKPWRQAALTALVAERDALQAKVKEHAEDRRKYIDAWADWIEANAGLEIDQWLRVYADAVPIPSPDGDEAKQRIFKHLDQRMRDASDAIDALRKRVAKLEAPIRNPLSRALELEEALRHMKQRGGGA